MCYIFVTILWCLIFKAVKLTSNVRKFVKEILYVIYVWCFHLQWTYLMDWNSSVLINFLHTILLVKNYLLAKNIQHCVKQQFIG